MSYTDTFTPNNAMAQNLTNRMGNIKLDNSVSYAETEARIRKHHPELYENKEYDTFNKTNAPQAGTNTAQTDRALQNTAQANAQNIATGAPNTSIGTGAQTVTTGQTAAQTNFQTTGTPAQTLPRTPNLTTYQPFTPVINNQPYYNYTPVNYVQTASYPLTCGNVQPNYQTYYAQTQTNTPIANQYQTYQAPAQYAQTQSI